MDNFTKNEILTLKHLKSDGEHNVPPQGMTDALYYTALESLMSKDMVLAAFEEGGKVVDAMIQKKG